MESSAIRTCCTLQGKGATGDHPAQGQTHSRNRGIVRSAGGGVAVCISLGEPLESPTEGMSDEELYLQISKFVVFPIINVKKRTCEGMRTGPIPKGRLRR
ncbi:hypothetical protein GCM10025857_27760 [Alicyclobacillus contaminans]|nr:hypothetical protein GCM10025857_27760 [Alicyclobacillus contaminans]